MEDREGEKLNMLFKRPLLVYILFIYLYTIFKALHKLKTSINRLLPLICINFMLNSRLLWLKMLAQALIYEVGLPFLWFSAIFAAKTM